MVEYQLLNWSINFHSGASLVGSSGCSFGPGHVGVSGRSYYTYHLMSVFEIVILNGS